MYTIRRMSFEQWITKATNTDSEYVIFVAFPRLQWLRERASKSRFNVHCLSSTTPVWTDRDKLNVIREPPGSDQRYRPEKTIHCTPETSVIVISAQTWYKLRELLLEGAQGHALAQLVQALRCKPEGRGSLEFFIPAELWPWGRLKNEYQEYFLGW
jgi:hypothetical protein